MGSFDGLVISSHIVEVIVLIVFIKFVGNLDFEIHKIEDENGNQTYTEHKIFTLNEKGRLSNETLEWIGQQLNIDIRGIAFHVEEIHEVTN